MFQTVSAFLPYFSAVNIAVFLFFPALRKWVILVSSVIFIVLTAIHLVSPQSVSYTKFLLFNFISMLPVSFLHIFGSLPIATLKNLRSKTPQMREEIPLSTRIPPSPRAGIPTMRIEDLSNFAQGYSPRMTLLIAINLFTLVGMGVLMFFAVGATTIGWQATLISLYFLLPLFLPKESGSVDVSSAVVGMLLYFLAAFLAVGGLWLNDSFLHFSIETQTQNFLLIWPDYGDADTMFFAVCIFTILFQLYNLNAAMQSKRQAAQI